MALAHGKKVASSHKSSEVDAYVFIKNALKEIGWDTRNPSRYPEGEVYTQNECLSHPEIKKCLVRDRPENVVKVTDSIFWVIEAKRDHSELEKALKEARDYAVAINQGSTIVRALFISGVAGNDFDGFLVKTVFFDGVSWRPISINNHEMSSLLSPTLARTVLAEGPEINDLPVDESQFLVAAEKINQILHLGAINKNYRARVMAALLLSLVDNTSPNIDASPYVLIQEINARAKHVLSRHNKGEFFPYIEIALPPSEDNHIKFKAALVQTLQQLNQLNIRSAMNSGTDVLGKFYEVFLKYGNGAKEIGIVLTPRHITQFAVDVCSISERDIVFDPCCGTGGFLVAAFDYVKRQANEAQLSRFKENNIFGIDQEPEVVALAIVNMIFRGDGRNNIIEGNCFQKQLVASTINNVPSAKYTNTAGERAITRVLMNPPFALKASDEKEFRFVDYALEQMSDNGILFAVLPYSAMVRPNAYYRWRRESLLKKNTLLAVITFPEDLFYPVGVHTLGIIVRKGIEHPEEQNVLWIRAVNDGLLKRKGKRLPNSRAKNDYPLIQSLVKAFVLNPSHPVPNIEQFQKACPIDFDDPLLELVPENYLDQAPPTPEELHDEMDQVVRDAVAFVIRARKEADLQ